VSEGLGFRCRDRERKEISGFRVKGSGFRDRERESVTLGCTPFVCLCVGVYTCVLTRGPNKRVGKIHTKIFVCILPTLLVHTNTQTV
jgi:hypothetical protein